MINLVQLCKREDGSVVRLSLYQDVLKKKYVYFGLTNEYRIIINSVQLWEKIYYTLIKMIKLSREIQKHTNLKTLKFWQNIFPAHKKHFMLTNQTESFFYTS